MKIILKKPEPEAEIRNMTFFLEYLKIMGMVLFAISLTTPVIGLILSDVDVDIVQGNEELLKQLIWDKPILPYIAAFGILLVHWFKFTEVHHSLKTTNVKHILITFGFFFLLSLYPYLEINIEFTSGQANSRAIFTGLWGLMGLFSYWQLNYAQNNHLLKQEVSISRIKAMKREILGDPVVAVICIGLSYVNFLTWLIGTVVLIPVVNIIMARISIKKGH
jgi:uncharacterized membrane protein